MFAITSLLYIYLLNCEKLVHGTETQEPISRIFEAFGYNPSCIATTLASCTSDEQCSSLSDIFKDFSSEIKKELREVKPLIEFPSNCADLFAKGDRVSGVRIVYPYPCGINRPVSVFCDQTTDGGGWTVFQRRINLPGREDFYRTWDEYYLGFGNLTGEFWLGLGKIEAFVANILMELRVDLEDFEGGKRWAKYGIFHIGPPTTDFILKIGKYSGDAGDDLTFHNGNKFSTHDRDQDVYAANCAKQYRGAWWYKDCHHSNLNGFQYEGKHSSNADGINWLKYKGHGYSLKKTMMMIRPTFNHHLNHEQ